jgi:ACS family D-galactonate transporter-like MFS transporter
MTTSTAVERTRLPVRLTIVVVLLGIAVFLNYVDRGNLSIAAPMLKDELHLSATQLGLLLSAFFWTYVCMQNVAGWLVDRFNVNWVMAGGFFLWSVATAATGAVHVLASLFLLRFLLGIGESVAFPGYSKIVALNIPEEHRGMANSVVCAGLLAGPGIGLLLGGSLMSRFGWRPFFLVLGLGSLLWLIPWIKFMPKAHPSTPASRSDMPSYAELLRLRSAWGTFTALFFSNYANYFLITWLPYYLVRDRGFSLVDMGRIGGVAYLLAAGNTVFCGWLSDHWIRAGGSPTRVRKTFTASGIALSGSFLLLASITGPHLCVVMVILGVASMGMCASNVYAITQRLAGPKAAGRWTGFQGFVGNMAGILSPAITGLVLQRTGHFTWAFVILFAFSMTGAACWLFFIGQVEPVAWKQKPGSGVVPEALEAVS